MALVLDGMGSDKYPDPEVQAAVDAANLLHTEILLVGKQDLLEPLLSRINTINAPVRIIHAPDVLEMSDHPVEATRKKPLNSMAVGINLVKSGEADAFVTAGNTGAALFNAATILHKMQGVIRPALVTTLPTKTGKCAFLDMGANADCRPEFLVDFALMGAIYAETVMGIKEPRIGLLANGEEEGKGSQLVKDSHQLLKKNSIHFVGNVEPKEVFNGSADVVVTDGFTGNIFIKTSEAVGKFIKDFLKQEIKGPVRSFGGLLVKPAFRSLFKMMDPAEVGAGLLLGIKGNVFVGHGRSDSKALVSALALAKRAVDAKLIFALSTRLDQAQTS